MEMSGEYRIPAPRQAVWDSLNDPEVLKSCLSGCERLDRISDTAFEGVVTFKVGPIKATFKGAIELSEIDPPNGYVISGEGKGGAAGFAKGSATVRLSDDGDLTVLRYAIDARLGGKLGQMGGRVVDPVARRMADDFFGKFADAVGGAPDGGAATVATAPAPQKTAKSGLFWLLLIASAAALLALAAVFLVGGD